MKSRALQSDLRSILTMTLLALILSLILALPMAGQANADNVIHVSNNHPAASDASSGTADQPLATITEALYRARPGDTVRVGAGSYRESLTFPRSGVSDAPITLEAHANQDVFILGSDVVSGWAPAHDQIWVRHAWDTNSQQVFYGGVGLTQIGVSSPLHRLTIHGEPVLPATGAGLADMYPGTFWYDAQMGDLYVWLPDGSSPESHFMEASVRPHIIAPQAIDHIHLKGLSFAHSNTSVLGADGSMVNVAGSHWRIENCQFLQADVGALAIGGDAHVLEANTFALHGAHGVSINQLPPGPDAADTTPRRTSARSITLSGNETSYNNSRNFNFFNWKSAGVRALDVCEQVAIENHTALNNMSAGIWLDASCQDVSITRSLFKSNIAGTIADRTRRADINNNIFADNTFGLGLLSTRQADIRFNTFDNNLYSLIALDLGIPDVPLAENTLQNNLFNRTQSVDLALWTPDFTLQGNLSDDNAYGRDDAELVNEWMNPQGGIVRTASLADFQTQTGLEQDAVLLAALWTDAASDLPAFMPPADSPVINAAFTHTTDELLDYYGSARTQGVTDIGAVEYDTAAITLAATAPDDQSDTRIVSRTPPGLARQGIVTLDVFSGSGSGRYQSGETVTIAADAPASGKLFDRWTGDVTHLADAGSAVTSVKVPTVDVAVTAAYKDEDTRFSLNVTSGSGSGQYNPGEVVTIVANTAPDGKVFEGWTGDVSWLADAGSASTTVSMPSANMSVAASYVDLDETQSITIAWDDNQIPEPAGYIVLIGTASRNYDRQIDVGKALTATIDGLRRGQTYYISAKAYDADGNQSDFAEEIIYSVAVEYDTPAIALTATAQDDQSGARTVSRTRRGIVRLNVFSGSGSGRYQSGRTVNIAADAPANGKLFDRWTGDVTHLADAGSAVTSVKLPTVDVAVTATYKDEDTRFFLNVTSGSGSGQYSPGEVVTIVANTAPDGKVFEGWTGDVNRLADADSPSTTVSMPSANMSVAASYVNLDEIQSITIAWDDNQRPEPAGYIVLIGTASRNYDRQIDVGKALTATIDGLSRNQAYYISAKAYDADGNQSDFAEEISYSVSDR